MRRLLPVLLILAILSGCAHSRARARSSHPADPIIAVGAGLVILVGIGLLYGLIAECEQPGGNCSSDPPQSY